MRPYDCHYFLFIWIQLNLRVQVKPLLMVSFKVRQRNAYVASSAAQNEWLPRFIQGVCHRFPGISRPEEQDEDEEVFYIRNAMGRFLAGKKRVAAVAN